MAHRTANYEPGIYAKTLPLLSPSIFTLPHHRKNCNTHLTHKEAEARNSCLLTGSRCGEERAKAWPAASCGCLFCAKMLDCALGSRCFIIEFSILATHSVGERDCLAYQAKFTCWLHNSVKCTQGNSGPKGLCPELCHLCIWKAQRCSLSWMS